MTNRSRDQRGFTLLEMMIVVAIIGILASVAIPSFITYQLTSKQTEAFSNLAALARSQKAYYSEFNTYISVDAEPIGTTGLLPTSTKRPVAPVTTAFEVVGWTPEGNVFYDYDTHTPGDGAPGPCNCPVGTCFTAAAYGDLDGNGLVSVVAFAQPDPNDNICAPGVVGALPLHPNEPERDQTLARF